MKDIKKWYLNIKRPKKRIDAQLRNFFIDRCHSTKPSNVNCSL